MYLLRARVLPPAGTTIKNSPRAPLNPVEEAELRYQIRRLSSHASIAVWDGCNECQVLLNTSSCVYASFVMTVVAVATVVTVAVAPRPPSRPPRFSWRMSSTTPPASLFPAASPCGGELGDTLPAAAVCNSCW